MTRRRLTFFLAVTAIALQHDIAHSFPSQRYSPDLIQLARQNAVDTPENNMYRFLKQMELEQTLQREYSPINSETDDFGIESTPKRTPEIGLEEVLKMEALEHQLKVDAGKNNLYQRSYHGQELGAINPEYDPTRRNGIKFVSEEEVQPTFAGAIATRQGLEAENIGTDNFLERAEEIQKRLGGDMENFGGSYSPDRADDLQNILRQEEIQQENTFRELDSLKQQESLEQAIRQEETLQDITLRQASSLRQISNLRDDDLVSDPLQQFQVAREAFIYKEEIRQNMLSEQALRQEILRQEALRQEKEFEDDPERQEITLRQESEILQQLIKQEELRQENSKNLENAYLKEAAMRQEDPEMEQILLQKAQVQENIRQESENRLNEAIRQKKVVKKKISKIMQQVCINCGPKIVSVSNSHNIQI